ncbi:hypothetical protein MSP7336_04432 [Mycobacterium shimoidei]|uniref:Uncharacterized protein n=1 Tax=Mycobacterium shimoidei TaxID=29313 RepID=A0A375Z4Z4_MYCSH|nr:hypothetical protein [Mycobacterium shimoidei]SRX96156.1 hypothetical protein MSP7336_04432 [Mycobacterium shimoidei]
MQLALRPYATAGVVVVAASLIAITPVVAPNTEQRAVELAAVEDIIDLGGPIEAVGLADALPSLGDLSGALVDELPGADIPLSLAAGDDWWSEALPYLGALTFSIIFWGEILLSPILVPIVNTFSAIWEWLGGVFGFDPYLPAVEGLASAASFADVIPDTLAAEALDPLTDTTSLVSSAAEALDLTTVVQDLTAAFDPAEIGDIGELMSTGLIPDIGELLSGLIP